MTDKKPTDISYSSSSSETKPSTANTEAKAKSETKTVTEKKPASSTTSSVEKTPSNSTSKTVIGKKKNVNTQQKKTETLAQANNKTSKVGILALLIALIALGGGAYLFWFNQQQQVTFEQKLAQQNEQKSAQTANQVKQQLAEQRNVLGQTFTQLQQQLTKQLQNQSSQYQQAENRIQQLEMNISRLSQNKPSDWLLHEAEYLIRIAVRTIWLEQDTSAAINLLQDADSRLTELNDPQFLPVRQLIHDDISALKLMPTLATENILLSLSSLHKQIPQLTLAMAQVPEATTTEETLELTNDSADWRENLAKTWRRLLGDFITVTRRTGNVEPLMSPQHQQNLRENLALKIQQAQWAAREKKTAMYQQSLDDINAWLSQYFDMSVATNKEFVQSITQLKSAKVSFAYPSSLSSLDAIRDQISNISVSKNLTATEADSKESSEATAAETEKTTSKASTESEVQ